MCITDAKTGAVDIGMLKIFNAPSTTFHISQRHVCLLLCECKSSIDEDNKF